MTNKAKVVGSNWEHDLAEILEKGIDNSKWKRIPGSGAIGTNLGEPLLTGDVKGEVENYPKKFRVECKAGYNSSTDKEVKQFTLKKEWLDKIVAEAEASHAIPMLAGKFSGARSGVKHFIVLPIKVFIEMINEYTATKDELDALYWELENVKRKHMGSS